MLRERGSASKANTVISSHDMDNGKRCKVYDVDKKELIAEYDSMAACAKGQGIKDHIVYYTIQRKTKTYNNQGIHITIR